MKKRRRPGVATALPAGFSRRLLTQADAGAVSALLSRQRSEYCRYFTALPYDEATLVRLLASARLDVYGGYFRGDDLAGLYLLRGWDEGYEVPSLGVLVDEKYRGVRSYKLMRLTVAIGKQICRDRGVRQIMYKSHPANTPARAAWVLEFKQTGVDERSGYHIFHLDLDAPA